MYPLYSDKPNLFECAIQLEGCSLNDASARLIIESEQNSLVFNGEIDNTGACLIPVKKLKGLVSEGGSMKLEVIADDMYFSPWESEYELLQSKQVTVEVKTPSETEVGEFDFQIENPNGRCFQFNQQVSYVITAYWQ